jgi:hypothetical protein
MADPEVMIIQGKPVDSKEEYWVAEAFRENNWRFIYQYPLNSGTRLRGGQVLDFLVYTPIETAVPVHGDHWHTGQQGVEERLKTSVLLQKFPRVVELWGHELTDKETTKRVVNEKVA